MLFNSDEVDLRELVFAVPAFDDVKLRHGQRDSTWPSITPSQRGPKPWPDWVITSAAAIDTELGIVKTGKEADVFLLERAVPDGPSAVLAAKRYRGADHRDFHRSSAYEEGRRTRKSRDARAIDEQDRLRTDAPSRPLGVLGVRGAQRACTSSGHRCRTRCR